MKSIDNYSMTLLVHNQYSIIFQKISVNLIPFSISISHKPLDTLRPFLYRNLRGFSFVFLSASRDALLEAVLSGFYTKPSTRLILPVAVVLKKSLVSSLMVGCLYLFSW